jgi:hypothetical protein
MGLTLFGITLTLGAMWLSTWSLMRRLARRPAPPRVVLRSRGAAMTETVIVVPLYLLMILGLAQLTINYTAGLLASLASYESARTLAVWGPEAAEGRRSVTNALALDKARVAAAGVLAPVAHDVSVAACTLRPTILHAIAGIQSAGNRAPQSVSTFGSLAEALDGRTLAERGLPKYVAAYCATDIDVERGAALPGQPFTLRLEYRHINAMPLVGHVFANRRVPGLGWVTTIERTYNGTAQIQPNKLDPACSFCPGWAPGIW